MKRSLALSSPKTEKEEVEAEAEEIVSLPDDVLQVILVQTHGYTSQLSTVCKRWQRLIESYTGWYAMLQHNYRFIVAWGERLPSFPPGYAADAMGDIFEMIEKSKVCQQLSEAKDIKYQVFLNHIGYVLNSKVSSYIDFEDVGHSSSNVMLESIRAYLPGCLENVLSVRNFHPRDFYLNFKEINHRYSLPLPDEEGQFEMHYTDKVDDNEGVTVSDMANLLVTVTLYWLCSVTTFIHSLFWDFDEDAVIDKMMAAPKWSHPLENPYYGMTKEEIKEQWREIRTQASADGTAMHANLEMYYSGRAYKEDTVEFGHFKEYEKVHVTGKLRPYRTEWTIYSILLQLCGSVDMLYEYADDRVFPDGKKHLVMADWKRSKKIEKYNSWQSGSKPCTETAGDCNYIHYTIQLSLYKWILEEYYDVVIDEMYLVVLHPNQPKYICMPIDTKHSKAFVDGILQHRYDFLQRSRENQKTARAA